MKNPDMQASAAKASFLRSLWQGVLRFDEALNSDPRSDLARRVAALERQIEASHSAVSDSPPRQ
jgi:hypothetical protein